MNSTFTTLKQYLLVRDSIKNYQETSPWQRGRKFQNSMIWKGSGLKHRGFPLTAIWIYLAPIIRQPSLLGKWFQANYNGRSFTSHKQVFHNVVVYARTIRANQTRVASFNINGLLEVTALCFCGFADYFLKTLMKSSWWFLFYRPQSCKILMYHLQ